jgi:hypothetical protein
MVVCVRERDKTEHSVLLVCSQTSMGMWHSTLFMNNRFSFGLKNNIVGRRRLCHGAKDISTPHPTRLLAILLM